MNSRRAAAGRGGRQGTVTLQSRPVRHSENGLRSVSLDETLARLEVFFLKSGLEVQFLSRTNKATAQAILEYLSPSGPTADERFFGKGLSASQALASACMEFIERWASRLRPEDVLFEGAYETISADCRDPELFCLARQSGYRPSRRIDWVWGYSLTHRASVRVPANLVFCPYAAGRQDKYIAWIDSNGLAAGNTLEEAVLHGLLEVIERDAVMIGEYNRLPQADLNLEGAAPGIQQLIEDLDRQGFRCSLKTALTDFPFPVIAAFLCHSEHPANCCVAFGCHLDPELALSRAITEAVQLLPPSVNQQEWLLSGAAQRFEERAPVSVTCRGLENLVAEDLKENIDTCLAILARSGSEVIVVDLSLPELPFPVVRVLVTGLQPIIHTGDRRYSRRFFEVPEKLGIQASHPNPESLPIWPIVGYR